MSCLPAGAHRFLARQHGVIGTHQLLACGLSHRQVHHLAARGDLELVIRGAYRSPSVPISELARCAALCLARPDVAIAAHTAGRLWAFRRVSGDRRIHVLAPPAANPTIAPWAQTYRTGAVHRADVVQRCDGIRLTTRPRTALDLARSLGIDDLRSVVEQAIHDGRHTPDELRRCAIDWISPQRPWIATFLDVIDTRLGGAAAESHPEVRLGEALRRAGADPLVRQYRVDLPGYGPARFDLAVPDLRWAIEVDVHPSHEERPGVVGDGRRDRAAAAAGWLVSRVSADRYAHGFDDAVEWLRATFVRLASDRR